MQQILTRIKSFFYFRLKSRLNIHQISGDQPFHHFYFYFILSFAFGLFIFIGLAFLSKDKRDYDQGSQVEKIWPPQFVHVLGAETPNKAKKLHQWWLELSPTSGWNQGVGLSLLEQPNLLHKVFPGYPISISHDSDLWNQYFSKRFDSGTWFFVFPDYVNKPLSLSYLGALEIFHRYGADTLVLGNSETYQRIHLESLYSLLGEHNNRILLLARSGGLPLDIILTANYINHIIDTNKQKKIKRVILGYSFWWTDPLSQTRKQNLATLEKFYYRYFFRNTPPMKIKNTDLLSWILNFKVQDGWDIITWYDFIQVSYDENKRKIEEAGYHRKLSRTLTSGLEFKLNDYKEVLAYLAQQKLNLRQTASEEGCNNTILARKELEEMLQAILNIAEKIYIYIPPINIFAFEDYHPCHHHKALQLLKSFSNVNDRVMIKTDHSDMYGLSWQHFILPGNYLHNLRIDKNHTNIHGSFLVTQKISEWILKSQKL